MKNTKRFALQAGFSLVELLVSIAIGLVILVAIGLVFVNSSNINRQKEDSTDSYEPIKIVTNSLKYSISMAGYIDPFDGTSPNNLQGAALFTPGSTELQNLFARSSVAAISTPLEQIFTGLLPVFGCDGDMSSTPNALAVAGAPASLGCSSTASATKNSVQLAYQVAPVLATSGVLNPSVTAPNAATGDGMDCLQQALPSGTSIVINRFYVAQNTGDGVNELYCAGSGNATSQPIARGVEEFVIRYQMAPVGVSIDTASGNSKTQYLTATQVSSTLTDWARVVAVEICMVTATVASRGAATGTSQLQTTRPTCERETSSDAFKSNIARASGDTRLWKRSTFTYTVRNAIFTPAA